MAAPGREGEGEGERGREGGASGPLLTAAKTDCLVSQWNIRVSMSQNIVFLHSFESLVLSFLTLTLSM